MTTTKLDTDHLREVAEHHGSNELRQIADALDLLRPLHERGVTAPWRYVQELERAGFVAESKRTKYGHRDLVTRFYRRPIWESRLTALAQQKRGDDVVIYHPDGEHLVPALEEFAAARIRYLEQESNVARHLSEHAKKLLRQIEKECESVERRVMARSAREARLEAIEQLTKAIEGLLATAGEEVGG